MHNPLRSEAEAFKWVVVIGLGALSVIAVALVISGTAGFIWGLALIVAGCLFIYRASRGSEHEPVAVTRGGDGRHRVLVMANQTVRSPELIGAVLASTKDRKAEIRVVVPSLPRTRADLWASATDEAAERARQRMELTVIDLQQAGRRVRGEVGDSDPNQALADTLSQFPADEILISTLPPEKSHWLEQGVVERARDEINLPVRHLIWDPVPQSDPPSPQPKASQSR